MANKRLPAKRSDNAVEVARVGLAHAFDAWARRRTTEAMIKLKEAEARLIQAEKNRGVALEELEEQATRLENMDSIRALALEKLAAEHLESDAEIARLKRVVAQEESLLAETVENAEINALKRQKRKIEAERELEEAEQTEKNKEQLSPLDRQLKKEQERLKRLQALEELLQTWFKQHGVTRLEDLPQELQDSYRRMRDILRQDDFDDD